MCHHSSVEIQGQHVGDCSLLPPPGSLGQTSGHQAWQQAPLLTKPSHQTDVFFYLMCIGTHTCACLQTHVLVYVCMCLCVCICVSV